MDKLQLLYEKISKTPKTFNRPENYDQIDEFSGWEFWLGGNDWEDFSTAVWAINKSGDQLDRVWFYVDFEGYSADTDDTNNEIIAKYKDRAKDALKLWIKTSKEIYKQQYPDGAHHLTGYDLVEALKNKQMQSYVKQYGVDRTQWQPRGL